MACHLRFTLLCILLFGCCGFLLSMLFNAPFYFSIKWSDKYVWEKANIIGWPCLGALSGLIIARKDISKRSSSAQRPIELQSPERLGSRAMPHSHPGTIPPQPTLI